MLKLRHYLFLFIYFNVSFVFAQNEINITAFVSEKGLDFNSGVPHLIETKNVYASPSDFGVSSICDANGNLLFYTNNREVWNKNHQPMLNSGGIKGLATFFNGGTNASGVGYNFFASCIIVPKPQSPNKYLIFTSSVEDETKSTIKLYYSEVDMSLDNNLGAVTSKNNLVYSGIGVSFSAVRHSNKNDIWILTHLIGSYSLACFLVTSSSVNPPVISNFVTNANLNSVWDQSNIQFSPSGKKAGLSINSSELSVFDFNNSTGSLSNQISLTINDYQFGNNIEFSPSENFMYTIQFPTRCTSLNCLPIRTDVYQYNVSNLTLQPTLLYSVAINPNNPGEFPPDALFLGPDGKIYFSDFTPSDNRQNIFIINHPNLPGNAAQLTKSDLTKNFTNRDYFNFRTKYLRDYALNPNKESTCSNTNFQLFANSPSSVTSASWDFGDGSTSMTQNPTHNYISPGTYNATATLNTNNGTETIHKTITVYESPVANPVPEQHLCINPEGIQMDLNQFNTTLLGNQSSSVFDVSYYALYADATNNNAEITSPVLIANDTSFYAKVYNKLEGYKSCYDITEIKFKTKQNPKLTMLDKYFICPNNSVILDSGSGYDHYNWSTGEATQSISVSSPGTYSITVSNDFQTTACTATKDIIVESSNKANIISIEIFDFNDGPNALTIYVDGFGDYEYSIDGIHYQSSNHFDNLNESNYEIFVKDKNGCGITTKEVVLLSYPKFFTPNNDGYNDYWTIKNFNADPNLTISIFDRYGSLLDVLSNEKTSWDGKLNGKPLPSTDYWFSIKKGNGKIIKGHFTLKR